jgi:hypothetical protein
MSFRHFSQLRNNLHTANNLERPNYCVDKLYKVRPILDCWLYSRTMSARMAVTELVELYGATNPQKKMWMFSTTTERVERAERAGVEFLTNVRTPKKRCKKTSSWIQAPFWIFAKKNICKTFEKRRFVVFKSLFSFGSYLDFSGHFDSVFWKQFF